VKGLHRRLNTKKDYAYIKANEPAMSWMAAYRDLLDGLYCWQTLGENDSADDYDAEAVRTISDGDGGETVTQVYKQDENCRLFRLGFSVAEVESILRTI